MGQNHAFVHFKNVGYGNCILVHEISFNIFIVHFWVEEGYVERVATLCTLVKMLKIMDSP